ncbi:hypothetical protein L873DRAFT_1697106, partial [Choiromyces venosus 120613-1]
CCTQVLLASQSDFNAQKREIAEAMEAARYLVLFYLPFHCKIIFIEYFWRVAKEYTQMNCSINFLLL